MTFSGVESSLHKAKNHTVTGVMSHNLHGIPEMERTKEELHPRGLCLWWREEAGCSQYARLTLSPGEEQGDLGLSHPSLGTQHLQNPRSCSVFKLPWYLIPL